MARRACFRRSDGMRARIAVLSLSVFLGAAVSSAQNASPGCPAAATDYSSVNCSGFVSGPESARRDPDRLRRAIKLQDYLWSRGDNVHINRGQDKGVRVGDRFSVMRPEEDPNRVPWFKWQSKLLQAMGTLLYGHRTSPRGQRSAQGFCCSGHCFLATTCSAETSYCPIRIVRRRRSRTRPCSIILPRSAASP